MAPGAEIDVVAAAAAMRQARTEQPLRQMPIVVLELPEIEDGFRTRSACLSYRSKRWSWPSRRRGTTSPPSCPARST